jgi:negative regulator of sigma-B (phosphoserine phosphatase)
METASSLHQLDWAVAQRSHPGERVSGDTHVVVPHARGALIAVIDGCGHGPEAARAAAVAAAILRAQPEGSAQFHLGRCHTALADSRGAVMTIADYNARQQTLTLCGVGNVETTLFHAAPSPGTPAESNILLRGGVVGGQLPPLHSSIIPVKAGDVLVMLTDGLRPIAEREQVLRLSAQRLASLLLDKNFKGSDDALALVVRFPAHEVA